jgi:hypothetical protein
LRSSPSGGAIFSTTSIPGVLNVALRETGSVRGRALSVGLGVAVEHPEERVRVVVARGERVGRGVLELNFAAEGAAPRLIVVDALDVEAAFEGWLLRMGKVSGLTAVGQTPIFKHSTD